MYTTIMCYLYPQNPGSHSRSRRHTKVLIVLHDAKPQVCHRWTGLDVKGMPYPDQFRYCTYAEEQLLLLAGFCSGFKDDPLKRAQTQDARVPFPANLDPPNSNPTNLWGNPVYVCFPRGIAPHSRASLLRRLPFAGCDLVLCL